MLARVHPVALLDAVAFELRPQVADDGRVRQRPGVGGSFLRSCTRRWTVPIGARRTA